MNEKHDENLSHFTGSVWQLNRTLLEWDNLFDDIYETGGVLSPREIDLLHDLHTIFFIANSSPDAVRLRSQAVAIGDLQYERGCLRQALAALEKELRAYAESIRTFLVVQPHPPACEEDDRADSDPPKKAGKEGGPAGE